MPMLPPDIPKKAHPLLSRLLASPDYDWSKLENACIAHAKQIRSFSCQNEFLEPDLAESIAKSCVQLINMARTNVLGPQDHILVQAAARYFVSQDDGDDDTFLGGLDSDRAVLNAIASAVGYTQLCVEEDEAISLR